jgi:hypothetical protein
MSLDNLRNGVGIGLHADTIIGPVKFDYAVGEQHRYTVYFSASFEFLTKSSTMSSSCIYAPRQRGLTSGANHESFSIQEAHA